MVYLDDGLGAAPDRNKAKIASFQVHADLLKSGFLPNETKCVWEPTQVITWLGAVLNTSTSKISATDKLGRGTPIYGLYHYGYVSL